MYLCPQKEKNNTSTSTRQKVVWAPYQVFHPRLRMYIYYAYSNNSKQYNIKWVLSVAKVFFGKSSRTLRKMETYKNLLKAQTTFPWRTSFITRDGWEAFSIVEFIVEAMRSEWAKDKNEEIIQRKSYKYKV